MAPKSHANLGASKAERWMNCPGSVALEAPLPNTSSEFSREGTAAHQLLEQCLQFRMDAVNWLDHEMQVVEHDADGNEVTYLIEVTEEMCEAVQVMIDQVWRLVDHPQTELMIEQGFDLGVLNPPGEMFGTADAVVWAPHVRHLAVVDYKHGAGVAVDAHENAQLMYYALGAVLALDKKPETISATIVQPRAFHQLGPIRTYTFSFAELIAFKQQLFAAAQITTLENAPLAVGEWCKFCKAMPVCPEQLRNAQETAQAEFALVEIEPQLPTPEILSDEQISAILGRAELVKDWLRSIQQHVQNKLERGETVPGWKLVPKRATRRWASANAESELTELGLAQGELYEKKLVSVAQAEKKLRAAGLGALPEEMFTKVSSGNNLAPEHDPRPNLPTPGESAAEEFGILPNPETPAPTKKKRARRTRPREFLAEPTQEKK